MARKIVIANLKGGVGKTNVCINLAMFLTALGKRVLLIDLSPQGDASFSLGINASPNFIGDVLLQKIRPQVAIKSTSYFGFDVMPSFSGLDSAINNLRNVKRPELRLKKAIENLEEDYDFIIIDTPPEFDLLILNALYSADELIIPIQAEYLAMRSAKQLLDLIQKRNIKIKKISALITMYGWRSKISRNISKTARDDLSINVLNSIIPRATILAQTGESKEPILKVSPNSRAARAYRQLAEEVVGK
ncbi:AAA family ATPase [Patescibacteria group bacterium]|nr:AAA family ATPase [Patescibacteria group bacterium]MBU4023216.1 AAA family ATPase [Patescibacteria group bacterium]MBU4078173.1 AAA family ATPase [Patescibacteria group bacterium]